MKSTFEQGKTEEQITFPILMECNTLSSNQKLVVCFQMKFKGTVLVSENCNHKVGSSFDQFSDCTNKQYWKKFTGKITLENS